MTHRGPGSAPPEVVHALARAYARVFALPPWNERREEGEVARKLLRETASPGSFLTVMAGDGGDPVAGFCWGAVVPVGEVHARVELAHPAADARRVDDLTARLRAERMVFVDEVAVLPRFRGGVEPLRFLFRPLLEIASEEGLGVLCWTSPRSPIHAFLRHFGFRALGWAEDIVFLWASPALAVALSTLARRLSPRGARRLIGARAALARYLGAGRER